ncbi:DUF4270 family protein [Larkinella soli]|uniref:DUF4270 family protein n=1 Tax=Larkinella soli TaxID=1770527 RepID=UPI000FFC9958|nr:DUF4270 family protein [Larkinella soli]
MKYLLRSGLLLTAAGFALAACQSGDPDIGQEVINPNTLQMQYVDSITVRTSTVLMPDSFVTSSDSSVLVGRWNDPRTGTLTGSGFTSVDYVANDLGGRKGLRLDSLVLELGYSFSYGDTTAGFSLNIHQLTGSLSNSQTYYNSSSAGYQADPLIQYTFRPRPNDGTKKIRMRIPNAVAQSFFDRLIAKEINDTETMTSFWKGLALVGQAPANLFLAFRMVGEQTGLRLYYHANDIGRTASSLRFPLELVRFSRLVVDRKGATLEPLQKATDAVTSDKSGKATWVGVGIGLRTRIEFPALGDFIRPEDFVGLNRAELFIQPIRREVRDNAPPPEQLALFQTNRQNELIATVPAGSSGAEAATALYGFLPNELELQDGYIFNLTQYISQVIRKQTPNRPLILTVSADRVNLRTVVRQVTLGDQKSTTDRIRLRLLMTSNS